MSSAKRNDLEMYETHAIEWWNGAGGHFRSLRGISEFRLKLLTEWVPDVHRRAVVDVGCGGGLLAAPLSKLGARVVGVDISPASLEQARLHSDPSARFLIGDARAVPVPAASADLVVLADVLDHIPDYEKALEETHRILRPGGLVYINTINRNWISRLLAVSLCERIGLVPRGTHDPKLFIRPAELKAAAERRGLEFRAWQGERPDLGKTIRNWAIHFAPTDSLAIAYSGLFARA